MKFYVETVTEEKNQNTQDINDYDSLNEAEIAYHENMASAILNENINYVRCSVRNEYGQPNMQDTWEPTFGDPVPHYLTRSFTNDAGEVDEAMFRYDSKDLAVSAWHSLLAQEMKAATYKAVLAIVEDKAGNFEERFKEYWQRNAEVAV